VGLALGEMWDGPKFRYHPGWATLRLPEPSQREADALGSDMTHPLSLGDANAARVAIRPGYPNPMQPVAEEDTGSA
jgi:hypothetical protein